MNTSRALPLSKPYKSSSRPSSRRLLAPVVALSSLLLLSACSDGGNDSNGGNNGGAEPFAEILAQGINRYLGLYTPMTSEITDGITTHTFGTGDGPLCLDGSSYRMATMDAGSEELVIYMQGGGACWSAFCAATSSAPSGIPQVGVLDPNREDNPMKDMNQVYLPYCDGGLHSSDRDNDYDNDGTVEAPQRGLHNLSAALDVAVTTFPSPRRIVLTGASGGGFGTIFALPLVRSLYPGIPIDVVNDSGVGIGKPGDKSFLELLMTDWNQSAFIPASCEDCLGDDGHLTNFLIWQLDEDPDTRLGMMTATQDSTIADFFLGIGGPAFEAALLPEFMDITSAHPDRYRYWITEGTTHTYIQLDPDEDAGGVTAIDWISAMLTGEGDWEDRKSVV